MNSNSGGGHCRQIINVCNADMINDDDGNDLIKMKQRDQRS